MMNFIKIPKAVFEEIPEEQRVSLGISNPLTSINNEEVLIHLEFYDLLIGEVLSEEEKEYPFKVYSTDSAEFKDLLNSEEWKQQSEF